MRRACSAAVSLLGTPGCFSGERPVMVPSVKSRRLRGAALAVGPPRATKTRAAQTRSLREAAAHASLRDPGAATSGPRDRPWDATRVVSMSRASREENTNETKRSFSRKKKGNPTRTVAYNNVVPSRPSKTSTASPPLPPRAHRPARLWSSPSPRRRTRSRTSPPARTAAPPRAGDHLRDEIEHRVDVAIERVAGDG